MKVLILQGLPASGKSTYARNLVDNENYVRVNKDDIRAMCHNYKWSKENERFVVAVRDIIIVEALAAQKNVVVDDTNFNPKHITDIKALTDSFKPEVEVKYIDTPVEVCLDRNRERNLKRSIIGEPELVTDKVILTMYNQFVKPQTLFKPEYAYEPPEGKPNAIMVDIDGTLAHMTAEGRLRFGKQAPFMWNLVGEDEVDGVVKGIVNQYFEKPWQDLNDDTPKSQFVILLSGRDEVCREETEKWLALNDVHYDELFMRVANDNRKDNIIKRELFDKYVRDNYRIDYVLDDRNQVVKMWRELGLKVLQVADGDF